MFSEKKQTNLKAGQDTMGTYLALFEAFREHNIEWCSWKSNEHLIDGLEGNTDVDLLFHESDRPHVLKIMHDFGFIFFRASAYRSYPGIVDTIAIAPGTGKILHAHTHFILATGKKYLKGLVLPWNALILEKRIASEISPDIFIAAPDMEMLLLIVREALKIRWRDTRRSTPSDMWGGRGFQKEFDWLQERTTPAVVRDLAKELLDPEAANLVYDLITQGATFARFAQLKDAAENISRQNNWERMGPVRALYKMWVHEGMYLATRIAEKAGVSQQIIIRRRVLPGHGLIVAFIGPDGSGKSTVTKTIVAQWKNKIDIVSMYFGAGDGAQTVLQKIFKVGLHGGLKLKRLLGKIQSSKEIESIGNADNVGNVDKPSPATVLGAIVGVLAKKKQIRRVRKLRARGFIVVCDRWPQNQISGINDGPLLSPYEKSDQPFYRWLAHWEKEQFDKIGVLQQPDIVIRLSPSLDVAVSRKVENEAMEDIIRRKIETLKKLKFVENVEEHNIEADKPLQDVLEHVRKIIWGHLKKRFAPKPDFYECFGLPGAGKSTVCREAYRVVTIKSIDDIFDPQKPIGTLEKIGLTLRSLVFEPVLYGLILKFIFDLGLWRHKERLDCLLRLPVQKQRLKKAAASGPYLLEQLLLQNIWSALVSAEIYNVKPASLSPLITALYRGLDTTVFYFDILTEEAARRVSQRTNGTSRFDGQSSQDVLTQLKNLSSLTDDIRVATLYAGVSVVRIDARLPVEQNLTDKILPVIKGDKEDA